MNTKTLKAEHEKITGLLEKIKNIIGAIGFNPDIEVAKSLRIYLVELFGLIKVHIEKEDQELYPELLRSLDPELRDAAASIVEENKKIASLMQSMETKSSVMEIYNLPKKFSSDFTDFSTKLADRISIEDIVIFKIADLNKVEFT